MKWAAMNTLGAGVWLLGVFYAKPPHGSAVGILDGGEHQFALSIACAAIGAAILLWTNLRSAA